MAGLISICLLGGVVPAAEEEDQVSGLVLNSEQAPGLGSVITEETIRWDGIGQAKMSPAEVEILREYGFLQLVSRRYGSTQGEIVVSVYGMKDFKAAFGLYTFLKMPGGRSAKVGDGSVATASEIVFWQSNYCIRIHSQSAAASLNRRIAQALSQRIARHSDVPVLVTYLPETGLQYKSVRYFLGFSAFRRYLDFTPEDTLGFIDEVEAIVADYVVDSHKGRIILLGYANHPLSIHYYRSLEPLLENQRSRGPVYSKRSGVIVAILLGDFDPSTAEKLLSEVTYAESVRWIYEKRGVLDRAKASYNALPLLGTVVNALVLTGVLGLASMGAGVLTGGLWYYRQGLRRGSPEQTNAVMIRLNLRGF